MSRALATPRIVARQAPFSMGLPRQEYWSRLPFPSPGNLSDSGIKTESSSLQVVSCITGEFFTTGKPWNLVKSLANQMTQHLKLSGICLEFSQDLTLWNASVAPPLQNHDPSFPWPSSTLGSSFTLQTRFLGSEEISRGVTSHSISS